MSKNWTQLFARTKCPFFGQNTQYGVVNLLSNKFDDSMKQTVDTNSTDYLNPSKETFTFSDLSNDEKTESSFVSAFSNSHAIYLIGVKLNILHSTNYICPCGVIKWI